MQHANFLCELYDFWIDPAGGPVNGFMLNNPALRQCGNCKKITMVTASRCICGYEDALKSTKVPASEALPLTEEELQQSQFGVAGVGDCKPRKLDLLGQWPNCSFGRSIPGKALECYAYLEMGRCQLSDAHESSSLVLYFEMLQDRFSSEISKL